MKQSVIYIIKRPVKIRKRSANKNFPLVSSNQHRAFQGMPHGNIVIVY
jgi:hypothetical protein